MTPHGIRRWRGLVYSAAVGVRVLAAVAAVALLGSPIALALAGRGAGAAGGLLAAGLALLGLGLPLVSLALARADWNGTTALLDRPVSRLEAGVRQPRSLIRPLAYTVLMLTLGGAVAVSAALLTLGSLVALISPFLAAIGDEAVIGPFTVRSVPESALAALAGATLLAGLVLLAPLGARAHAWLVLQVLPRPEQRLQHDLAMTAESRARLVRAFDVERRRIERDLHDGVQPRLLSVSMTLGLALAAMPREAPGREDVAHAQEQARQTLDSLRQFVRGIHPQVLLDHGLGAAVGELADTLAMPVTVDDRLAGRLPAALETNLYFCVSELLANAAKHSGADHAEVRLHRTRSGTVEIGVHDSGRGGASPGHDESGGLRGVADRIAALGGELMIDSPLGGPTSVTLTVTAHPHSGNAEERPSRD